LGTLRAGERRIAAADAHVRLGQDHLGVVEDRGEERPGAVETRDLAQTGLTMRRAVRLERRAQAIPARQVDAGLRPGERPGDRPQRIDRRWLTAARARTPACGRP